MRSRRTSAPSLSSARVGVSLLPDWSSLWADGLSLARIALPGRAPVRRTGLIWATRGAHASLSLALLREAEAIFSRPPSKVSTLPRRRA